LVQRLSWDTAGNRILSSGGLSTGFEAKPCLACDPAPCVVVCPTGAYTQRKGRGVVVKKSLCVRCGACDAACPVGAIYLDPTGEPFVCIHWGRCVPFCPHDCQEMAGYATGEVFFVSQALGFRHTHLDSGGYSYDQKSGAVDPDEAVEFLVQDEQERVFLTSMVACLFACGVFKQKNI
jgi:NAD-dependent dihydropyrimidine dehydrogenase PreA subunit